MDTVMCRIGTYTVARCSAMQHSIAKLQLRQVRAVVPDLWFRRWDDRRVRAGHPIDRDVGLHRTLL